MIGSDDNKPLTINEREAAKMLGCSPRHVFSLRKAGKIPCVHFGGLVRYNPDELREFVRSGGTKSRQSE